VGEDRATMRKGRDATSFPLVLNDFFSSLSFVLVVYDLEIRPLPADTLFHMSSERKESKERGCFELTQARVRQVFLLPLEILASQPLINGASTLDLA